MTKSEVTWFIGLAIFATFVYVLPKDVPIRVGVVHLGMRLCRYQATVWGKAGMACEHAYYVAVERTRL